MTPSFVKLRIHITGWRRLIGCPKLQIILHKRATKYRSLLRKMTYRDKGSYESSPPCMNGPWWRIAMTPMTRLSHRRNASVIYVRWRIHMCDMTYPHYDILSGKGTGWRRPIGYLKLQVIFCKRATNYGALLREMTCKDKASCGSSRSFRWMIWFLYIHIQIYLYICIYIHKNVHIHVVNMYIFTTIHMYNVYTCFLAQSRFKV